MSSIQDHSNLAELLMDWQIEGKNDRQKFSLKEEAKAEKLSTREVFLLILNKRQRRLECCAMDCLWRFKTPSVSGYFPMRCALRRPTHLVGEYDIYITNLLRFNCENAYFLRSLTDLVLKRESLFHVTQVSSPVSKGKLLSLLWFDLFVYYFMPHFTSLSEFTT